MAPDADLWEYDTMRSNTTRTYLAGLAGIAALALTLVASCGGDTVPVADTGPSVAFEKYELANGLDVILHVDPSDPIAGVAMTFHVGSAREVEGKTGFAHLFEHLFFLDSENLGPGGLDQLMTRVGSSTNGSTSRDRTNYFEVVPVDGLEKALWAEADKLGFFINTVTESVVDKERQVVKNEKRQSVDNRPYGHTSYVIARAMYQEGHPYRWQVIGSLADLDAASLADVREFHGRWYGPNNATLVVSGDIDVEQTKAWIEKYFGGIPAVEMPEDANIPEVSLADSPRLFHEDNYARLPRLTLAWPSVPMYHPDSYALDVLADILADGKTSPFYEVIVKEDEVAPAVSASNRSSELAGTFNLQVGAFADVDLDEVMASVQRAFARFEEQGISAADLERIKARTETAFYGGLSSAIGKAFQLAQYNIFAGDPGYLEEDLRRALAVTEDDVMRVYNTYVGGNHFVAASFVPKGSTELALEDSVRAEVVEETIVAGAEAAFTVTRGDALTPSELDRSIEPPYGDAPSLSAPTVWRTELANGVPVLGIEDREVPLVQFSLRLRGGHLAEDAKLSGVANLLAQTMIEGTANRTPEELETAIDMLGASISVRAGNESFTISGSSLARNYAETMKLVEEILLEPRFAPEEFERARQRAQNTLRQRASSPTAMGANVFNKLLYGDHLLATSSLGTPESIEAIEIADLQAFHQRTLVPDVAAFHVAGAVTEDEVMTSLEGIAARWEPGELTFPEPPSWTPDRAGLYFVDVPGAAQSVLMVGYLALAEPDPEFYPATVMNFRLGGGGFASQLTQELREGKGYTYGIGSGFAGTDLPGPFRISSSVRSNITLEALDLIKSIVDNYGPSFDAEDLEATQGFLLRANARAFESTGAKLRILLNMSAYDFPADYVLQREDIVREMDVGSIKVLAEQYLDSSDMVWLVVGDAATQLDRLSALGLGEPILLDRNGVVVGR